MSLSLNFPAVRPTLLLDFAGQRRLDPRITFTRASPATYYDGVTTAVAEQNLLLQSQSLAAGAWGVLGVTLADNVATAPDGTNTASRVTETATTGQHYVSQSLSTFESGTFTYSVYLKKGTLATAPDFAQLACGGTNTGVAVVNLATGSLISFSGFFSANITNAGNGWYRVSVSGTVASGAISFWVALTNNVNTGSRAPSYTGSVTSDILVWGAQVERRFAVNGSAYTATTTSLVTNYIPVLVSAPANMARFDHDPVTGTSLGLLIEEERVNRVLFSADFANANWGKSNASVISDIIVAPDGTLTGDKLVEDTSNTQHAVNQSFSATNTTLTFTAYAKAAERTSVWLQISNNVTGAAQCLFNLANGTVGTPTNGGDFTATSAAITPVGNGWYRCTLTTTKGASNPTAWPYISPAGPSNQLVYAGNGFSGVYIWGAQLEFGSFATSYIATTTPIQTRNADVALMTGTNFSSWYNPSAGSWLVNYQERAFSVAHQMVYTFVTGDTTNRINVAVNSSNILDVQVVANGTDTFDGNTPTLSAQNYNMAFAYTANNSGVSVNGSTVTTDVVVVLPLGINRLAIGSTSGAQFLNSTIAKIAYYDSRLTNAQLVALTRS